MAIDPEERKRQRLQRKQQQKARQRKTVIKLILAVVALVLCGLVIAWVIGLAGGSRRNSKDDTAPADTVIHVAAAGDLNVTQAVVASGGGEYDYTETLMDVAPILAQADIAAINFEGNLYGAPYGDDYSAPQTLVQGLDTAGVDLVQIANSYSIYKGIDGLSATVTGIRSAGMEPLGAYASAAEARAAKGYTIRNVNGVKIAFVAFTKGMDSMALPAGSEDCVNVLYTDYSTTYQQVDTQGISKILDAVEKEKPDITVAMLHWGSEFNDTISTSQDQICTLMQLKGVDAIIGTHSHYVQQMVFDEAAGTFVAYSLGDFLGDATRAGSEYSVILDLEITKDGSTGKVKITGYSYTPIFTEKQADGKLRVLRIDQAMAAFDAGYLGRVSQETYDAMAYALTRIEARIKGE